MVLPKRFPWYPEFVPDELKFGKFWVCCDRAKVPMIAGTSHRASSTNPKTWRSFKEACRAYNAGSHAGVGRIVAQNAGGFVGIDLDHVRDPETRIIDERALLILQDLDSYSEVSPSGEGVKIWIRARLDRSYVKDGLEIYRGGRYFVTTGQFLSQFPPYIAERQYEIDELVRREFPRREPSQMSRLAGTSYDGPSVDLDPFLNSGVVDVLGQVPDGQGVKFQIICPWAHLHSTGDTGTYVGKYHDGGPWFRCWHSHCLGRRTWQDFRRAVVLKAKKLRLLNKGIYR
jgi:hypothetical protein